MKDKSSLLLFDTDTISQNNIVFVPKALRGPQSTFSDFERLGRDASLPPMFCEVEMYLAMYVSPLQCQIHEYQGVFLFIQDLQILPPQTPDMRSIQQYAY